MSPFITQSIGIRAVICVLVAHMLILLFIVVGGHDAIDKRSNRVFLGEIIGMESAHSSKAVTRTFSPKEQISKTVTTVNQGSSDGQTQLNKTQDHAAVPGPVSMPSLNSIVLNNPKPPYPISSRENGEQGKVYLSACINELGKIDRLDLAKSSGYSALDRSALNTVRHWRFIPAQQNGSPIPMCYKLPINFVLSSHHRSNIKPYG